MSKATVSVVLVLPRIRCRLQCVKGLEPATRTQHQAAGALGGSGLEASCPPGPGPRRAHKLTEEILA